MEPPPQRKLISLPHQPSPAKSSLSRDGALPNCAGILVGQILSSSCVISGICCELGVSVSDFVSRRQRFSGPLSTPQLSLQASEMVTGPWMEVEGLSMAEHPVPGSRHLNLPSGKSAHCGAVQRSHVWGTFLLSSDVRGQQISPVRVCSRQCLCWLCLLFQ